MLLRLTELKLPLNHTGAELTAAILKRLHLLPEQLAGFSIKRRGYDARKKTAITFIYTVDIRLHDSVENPAILERLLADRHISPAPDTRYRHVATALPNQTDWLRPIVIGTGPCGLFAGLILSQSGFRPLILERGKPVRERTKDTFGLWRNSQLDPESNVQFGEGGAGTFSDGKLHSQIKDPGHYGLKVLEEFVRAGAPPEILYVSKPHIGTFRLVGMLEKMRETILALGGEIRFQSRADDIDIAHGQVQGVTLADGTRLATRHVVLAIGHSARDTFHMLHNRGVYMEAKPFSIGFRIEHPQSLIDHCRFGSHAGDPLLGAADYKIVHHCSNGRAVYSFCMCPGGTVVAATSEAGQVVTNGMSQYSRNERNANSGMVVGITPDDYPGHPLAGVDFQRHWEKHAFELGGSNYQAPAQLVGDFLANRASVRPGDIVPSYRPGVRWCNLDSALPEFAITALREALPVFDRQIPGFARHDAVLTGVETRTSSPVRIRRNDVFQSVNTTGLYPAGEGAGYAGGILSAAVDGIKVAEAVARDIVAASQQAGK